MGVSPQLIAVRQSSWPPPHKPSAVLHKSLASLDTPWAAGNIHGRLSYTYRRPSNLHRRSSKTHRRPAMASRTPPNVFGVPPNSMAVARNLMAGRQWLSASRQNLAASLQCLAPAPRNPWARGNGSRRDGDALRGTAERAAGRCDGHRETPKPLPDGRMDFCAAAIPFGKSRKAVPVAAMGIEAR